MWVLWFNEDPEDSSGDVLELYTEKNNAAKRMIVLVDGAIPESGMNDDAASVISGLLATARIEDRGFQFDVFLDDEYEDRIRGYILAAPVLDA